MTDPAGIRAYSRGAMLLHWAIALAIVLQIAGGFLMSRTALLPDAIRFASFQWHKTVGVAVIALTLARIAWRLLNAPPADPHLSRTERLASSAVHAALYALMLAVPLTGWALVSASPTRVPTLLALSEALPWPHLPGGGTTSAAGGAHAFLAYSFGALLLLHVAGAMKHSLVDRVPSLSRILPTGKLARLRASRRSVPVAVAAAGAFLVAGVAVGRMPDAPAAAEPSAVAVASAPSGWEIDREASAITFSVEFSGKRVAGKAGSWDGSISFDPAAPDAGSAEIRVDAASVSVEDAFLKPNLKSPDGLDVAAHPTALVRLDSFARAERGFVAKGTLEARGRSVPIELPFSYEEIDGGAARVKGAASFDRLALGLGEANDPGAKWLGREVRVEIDMTARRRPL